MKDKSHLFILWTNGNPITAEKMVFMYSINSLLKGWWEHITLIIWGSPAKLVSEAMRHHAEYSKISHNSCHIKKGRNYSI